MNDNNDNNNNNKPKLNIKYGFEEARVKTQFTKDNQPSSESKSVGKRKQWDYLKLRQQFLEQLTEVELADGRSVNFWEESCKIIQNEILNSKSKMSADKKVKIIRDLLELAPKDDTLNLNQNITGIEISFLSPGEQKAIGVNSDANIVDAEIIEAVDNDAVLIPEKEKELA